MFVAPLLVLCGVSSKQNIYKGIDGCEVGKQQVIMSSWGKALSRLMNQNSVHGCVVGAIIFLHFVKCLYFDYVSKVNLLLETRNAF